VEKITVWCAAFSWSVNLWQAQNAGCMLDELVVDESHRGRGIGTAPLARIFMEARTRELLVVEFASAAHRETAHRFYESHGFQPGQTKLFFKALA